MKERNYGLDLARVVLSICVIALHSFNHFGEISFHAAVIAPVVLISADGVFYMLSGYFNLEKEFNSVSDIKKYYKNKILYVLLPFLAFVLFWTIWDYVHLNNSFNFGEIMSIYYESIMDTSADGHMWFMYPLFGLLLSTPFLSKMLHNMDDKELKLLWRVAIGFNFVCYYVCCDMGTSFRVLAWFADGWPIYYIGGYYYRHVVAKESVLKWALTGLLGFVVTIFGLQGMLPFLKGFIGATDIQPMFTLFCMGCLLFWDKAFKFINKKAGKVLYFLSKNTFLIYLYHMRGIEYAVRKFNIVEASVGSGFAVVFGAFGASLIAAFVTNLLMQPVLKFIDKIWKIKEVKKIEEV